LKPVQHDIEEGSMGIPRNMSITIIAGLFIAGACSAQEKRIKRSDLPPAVEKTVAEVSKGATVRGFNEEKENGKVTYEVEMVVNGHSKDVQIDPNGMVTEVEEEVAMNLLPSEVKAGLIAKAGTGKILKVESLTKKEKLVAYEAKVETAGKKSEIQVGRDGKPLDHEE
jgi:uncharacterized membrane protein YkoI